MRQAGAGCWTSPEDAVFQPNSCLVVPGTLVQGTTTLPFGALSPFELTGEEEAQAIAWLMNATVSQPGVTTGCNGFSFRSVIAQATGPTAFNKNFRVGKRLGKTKRYQVDTTVKTSIPIISSGQPFPLGRLFIKDRTQAITGESLKKISMALGPKQTITQGKDLIGVPIIRSLAINADRVDLDKIANLRARQRDDLDQELKLRPETRARPHETYCLGQTDWIEIPEGIYLVIDTDIYEKPQARHLDSTVLDPEFRGKIRTEIETVGKPNFLWVRAYYQGKVF